MGATVKYLLADEEMLLGTLLNRRIVHSIDPSLCARRRVALVACNDGHQFLDLLIHHATHCMSGMGEEDFCCHPVPAHGGMLVLSERFLARRPPEAHGRDVHLLFESAEAGTLKHTSAIDASMHWPCGAAEAANFTLREALSLIPEVVLRLEREMAQFTFSFFLHVCLRKEGRKTYQLDVTVLERWLSEESAPRLSSS